MKCNQLIAKLLLCTLILANTITYSFANYIDIKQDKHITKVLAQEGITEDTMTQTEQIKDSIDMKNDYDLAKQLHELDIKDKSQDELIIASSDTTPNKESTTANADIYITFENVLILKLDTNNVTFKDFSGVEDVEKVNALNITITSTLPYQLNAYLPMEIQNSDKTNTMDKSILNIKENGESAYQAFSNTTDKVVLKDNCPAGNDLVHGIDFKLKGGIAHEKDVYKTTIKFEAEQK